MRLVINDRILGFLILLHVKIPFKPQLKKSKSDCGLVQYDEIIGQFGTGIQFAQITLSEVRCSKHNRVTKYYISIIHNTVVRTYIMPTVWYLHRLSRRICIYTI